MRAEFMVERLRAFRGVIIPNARRVLFVIVCFALLHSRVSLAQTSGIGLVVKGLNNPGNQFFPPFGASAQVVSSVLRSREMVINANVNLLGVRGKFKGDAVVQKVRTVCSASTDSSRLHSLYL